MKEHAERLESAFQTIMKKIGPQMAKLQDGLTPQQFLVLKLLQKDECTVSEIAHFMEVKPSAITAMLDRMNKSGFIVRQRTETDRRVVVVQITEKGQETLKNSLKKREEVMMHFLSCLDKDDLEALLNIYEKLANLIEVNSLEPRQ